MDVTQICSGMDGDGDGKEDVLQTRWGSMMASSAVPIDVCAVRILGGIFVSHHGWICRGSIYYVADPQLSLTFFDNSLHTRFDVAGWEITFVVS